MSEEMVTISKREYAELLERDRLLSTLEEHGVDNWTWYGEALSEFYGDQDKEGAK